MLSSESLGSASTDIANSCFHYKLDALGNGSGEYQGNSLMVRNLLDALSHKKSVRNVALVTGLKHYLGPFEAYAKAGTRPVTPVREEHPRLEIENFYSY